LLIGDANHQYIIVFTKWLKVAFPNIYISIISTNPNTKNELINNPYDDLHIALSNSNLISKVKGFRTLYTAWNIYRIIKTKRLGTNAILIHYAIPWLALISKQVKKRTGNFSIALWGSDFYRAKDKKSLDKLFNYVDNIIIATPQMIEDFNVEYGTYSEKVHLCYFGNEPLEYLDNSATRQQSCSIFNLSNDKLNMTIGHNGSKAHQHIKILNELEKLKPETAKIIRIILPMTYGLNPEYLDEVIKLCKNTSIEYKIYTDFMTENEVAHLRNLTDIMINLQTTDAFSGSMKEVLYYGGVVINGSWLPYQFLKKMGVYFEEVNSVQELPEKLNKVISDYNYYKMQCIGNPSKIYDISSWAKVITKWKEVIELQR
jgi:hypothetical protein